MAVTWTIVGEADKAIDATSRTLEQLAISDAKMDFRSLQADEFTFSIYPQSISGAIIPDLKQKIVLYRDAGAGPQRFFTGHVTNVRSVISAGSEVCNVTVSGPWWWMDRINFTSEVPTATTGVTAERMTAVFGDDRKGSDLGVALVTALNRSAALGVPITADNSIDPNTPGWFYVPGQVRCVRVQSDFKVVCAGDFTSANGTTVSKMVRFNEDGVIDTSFSCTITDNIGTFEIDSSGNFHLGLIGSGYKKISSIGTLIYSTITAGEILDLKIQSDGKILIGGKFTTVAGTAKIGIARLNADSTLDTGFTGPAFTTATNKWVRSIALSATGQIYIGGDFTITSKRNCLTRLSSTGADDITFQTKNVTNVFAFSKYSLKGSSSNNQTPYINNIKIQSDGLLVVCGGFIAITNVLNHIARFKDSGVIDSTFGASFLYTTNFIDIKENISNPTSRIFFVGGGNASNSKITIIDNLCVYKGSLLNVSYSDLKGLHFGSDSTLYGAGNGTTSMSGLLELNSGTDFVRYPPNYSSIGIATFFQVPRITLNQSTCAEIISELIRLCPDSMVYFDYSTELPKCNITRRGVCSTSTISIGSSPVTNIDVSPIVELKVSEVKLPYLIRNQDGSKAYVSQNAGISVNGEGQIITMSGKELDTFLPKDQLNSFTASDTTTNFTQYLLEHDSSISSILNTYGSGALSSMQVGGYVTGYSSLSTSSYGGGSIHTYSGVPVTYSIAGISAYNQAGTAIAASGTITTVSSLPAWATAQGLSIQQITVRGEVGVSYPVSYYKFSGGSSTYAFYSAPAWVAAGGFTITRYYTGYDPTYGYYTYELAKKSITCTAYLISGVAAGATVYQNADYSFAFPPPNLAANLLAAQNWLPYEGTIELVEQDVGAIRYRGTKVNIAGSTSALSSMGALVASESLDLGSGTTSIQLGCAPRNDYRTFVSKIRKTSQDNIIYLNE